MLILKKLFGARKNAPFEEIIGHDRIKKLFQMATTTDEPTHILLTGPPASAKTMFLLSLLNSLKNTYFIDGGNTTRAGIIDYLLANHPQYLLIDEIDKMSRQNQTFLLNLMETGIISETKYRKTRESHLSSSVFATCNDSTKLSDALLSRFFVVKLEPYTYEQFYEVTLQLLHVPEVMARIVCDSVWSTSRDIRDCVRIGKLARSEEDVKFLIENFIFFSSGSALQ
jgi:holliday junction DNA helicase RuvB